MMTKSKGDMAFGGRDGVNMLHVKNGAFRENMDQIRYMIEKEIMTVSDEDEDKKKLLKKLQDFCNAKTNIMLVGATGCGKSSTINALFCCDAGAADGSGKENGTEDAGHFAEVAKVGTSADPETRDVEKFTLGNLVIWDTPGLGDGTGIDRHHKELIQALLREKNEEGEALIDLVLLILDGSTKDLGTSYQILHDVILPELEGETDRILIALNQADVAMKTGRHWNYEKNEPDETLRAWLEEKVDSIKARVKSDTGLETEPVWYCAGYQEESGDTVRPYNLSKLLCAILSALPAKKRVTVMEGINTDADTYEDDDEDRDYRFEVAGSMNDAFDVFEDFFTCGLENGIDIGSDLLGVPGCVIGAVIGGAIGGIRGIIGAIFS